MSHSGCYLRWKNQNNGDAITNRLHAIRYDDLLPLNAAKWIVSISKIFICFPTTLRSPNNIIAIKYVRRVYLIELRWTTLEFYCYFFTQINQTKHNEKQKHRLPHFVVLREMIRITDCKTGSCPRLKRSDLCYYLKLQQNLSALIRNYLYGSI